MWQVSVVWHGNPPDKQRPAAMSMPKTVNSKDLFARLPVIGLGYFFVCFHAGRIVRLFCDGDGGLGEHLFAQLILEVLGCDPVREQTCVDLLDDRSVVRELEGSRGAGRKPDLGRQELFEIRDGDVKVVGHNGIDSFGDDVVGCRDDKGLKFFHQLVNNEMEERADAFVDRARRKIDDVSHWFENLHGAPGGLAVGDGVHEFFDHLLHLRDEGIDRVE